MPDNNIWLLLFLNVNEHTFTTETVLIVAKQKKCAHLNKCAPSLQRRNRRETIK